MSDYAESHTDYFGNSLVTDEVTEGQLRNPYNEDTPQAHVVTDAVTDEAEILSDMNLRLERIEKTVESLREGVNTIGVMMNNVAGAFDNIMQTVNKGGLGALLGGIMGGKKNA